MKAKFFIDLGVPCPHILDEHIEKIVANALKKRLLPDEYRIIVCHYGVGMQSKTIGEISCIELLNVTKVARIRDVAFRKIRWHATRIPLMEAITNHVATVGSENMVNC